MLVDVGVTFESAESGVLFVHLEFSQSLVFASSVIGFVGTGLLLHCGLLQSITFISVALCEADVVSVPSVMVVLDVGQACEVEVVVRTVVSFWFAKTVLDWPSKVT